MVRIWSIITLSRVDKEIEMGMVEIQKTYKNGVKAAEKYVSIIECVYDDAYDDTMSAPESIAWTMGFEGRNLVEVSGWRFGYLPESGRSVNYASGEYERGVSLMALDGDEYVPAVAAIAISDRPVVRVRGYLSGYGADGEPLVIGAEIIE